MIALKTLADNIQTQLNSNKQGIVFKIFADGGDYKRAIKTRTRKQKFTNGLLRIVSSSLIPTQGLTVAAQTARLEICVQLFDPDKDSEVIDAHRSAIDGALKDYTVAVIDDYTVSSVFSLADTGDISMRDGVATSMVFTVAIEFAYIENGLNSNNVKFTLDGNTIQYTAAKITKSPVAQADAYSNTGGKALTVNTSFIRSFDFQLPATKGDLGDIIMDELVRNDTNKQHTLKMTIGSMTYIYYVVFGRTDVSLEGVNNAGHNISLVEYK